MFFFVVLLLLLAAKVTHAPTVWQGSLLSPNGNVQTVYDSIVDWAEE